MMKGHAYRRFLNSEKFTELKKLAQHSAILIGFTFIIQI